MGFERTEKEVLWAEFGVDWGEKKLGCKSWEMERRANLRMLKKFGHFAFSILIWGVQEILWSKVRPQIFTEVCRLIRKFWRNTEEMEIDDSKKCWMREKFMHLV